MKLVFENGSLRRHPGLIEGARVSVYSAVRERFPNGNAYLVASTATTIRIDRVESSRMQPNVIRVPEYPLSAPISHHVFRAYVVIQRVYQLEMLLTTDGVDGSMQCLADDGSDQAIFHVAGFENICRALVLTEEEALELQLSVMLPPLLTSISPQDSLGAVADSMNCLGLSFVSCV